MKSKIIENLNTILAAAPAGDTMAVLTVSTIEQKILFVCQVTTAMFEHTSSQDFWTKIGWQNIAVGANIGVYPEKHPNRITDDMRPPIRNFNVTNSKFLEEFADDMIFLVKLYHTFKNNQAFMNMLIHQHDMLPASVANFEAHRDLALKGNSTNTNIIKMWANAGIDEVSIYTAENDSYNKTSLLKDLSDLYRSMATKIYSD